MSEALAFSAGYAQLAPDWMAALAAEFGQPYMRQLQQLLAIEKEAGKHIFPQHSEFFAALHRTPLAAVKVVIVGQDPYHGAEQAHGLCFSVRPGTAVPPSLHNIFKELHAELSVPIPSHGCLAAWADRGVLLLNSVLSVESGQAASHQGWGWETFTDRVIEVVNQQRDGVVFMLWGRYAQSKGSIVDASRHCVLHASHPSPLSAYRGFFGCGHFIAANQYRQRNGERPIDWRIPELK